MDAYFHFSLTILVGTYWVIGRVCLPLEEMAKALQFLPAIQEASSSHITDNTWYHKTLI